MTSVRIKRLIKAINKVPKSAVIGFGPEPEGSRRELLNYIRLSVNGRAHNNHKTAPMLGRIGSRNYTNYRTPQGWLIILILIPMRMLNVKKSKNKC